MNEPSHLRETRRQIRRVRNDARLASHTAWVVRMETLETRLRTAALAEEHLALSRRVLDRADRER